MEVQPEELRSRLLQNCPVVWRGTVELRHQRIPLKMHYVSGSSSIPVRSLPYTTVLDGRFLSVRRYRRVTPDALEEMELNMREEEQHCILIGLPTSSRNLEKYRLAQQLQVVQEYLSWRRTIGSCLMQRSNSLERYTLHILPMSDYSERIVSRYVPEHFATLMHTAFMLAVITKSE